MLFFVLRVDIFSSQMACKFVEVKDNVCLKTGKSSFHPAGRLRTWVSLEHPGQLVIQPALDPLQWQRAHRHVLYSIPLLSNSVMNVLLMMN